MIKTILVPTQALVHRKDFDFHNCVFNLDNAGIEMNKPEEALWTSEYREPWDGIPWLKWCDDWDFWMERGEVLYKITPKKNLKVAEINTADDYRNIAGNSFIDYHGLKKQGFDGLHFTQRAALLGQKFSLGVSSLCDLLYAISYESTVWFNADWIEKIEKTDWRRPK